MLLSKLLKKFAFFFFFIVGLETFKTEVLHWNWVSYKSEADKYYSIAGLAIFLITVEYFIDWYNAPKKKKVID